MIRGIGPVYAKKLLRVFGEKVFDVIEAEPDRLREVDGIGPVRASRIAVAWAEQKVVREIMVFLHSHGVGSARAVRIYKTYGADAVQVMSENPYRLARDILNGIATSNIIVDTTATATDTIDYVATDTWGNTATTTRIVFIDPIPSAAPTGTASSTRNIIIQTADVPLSFLRTMSPPRRQPQRLKNAIHGCFCFNRGATFFLCPFAADLASAAFARARAALLAAARLSGDHGVY
jgi:NAD-dependent DNA ligase